jgi:hypothetical protein
VRRFFDAEFFALFALFLLLGMQACDGGGVPTMPDPPPASQPSPTASPDDWGIVGPLGVSGGKYVDAHGEIVYPIGVIGCCDSGKYRFDWPFISRRQKTAHAMTQSDSLLQAAKEHGANLTEIRLGPFWDFGRRFRPYKEAGDARDRADLREFRPEFFADAGNVIQMAGGLGFIVRLDVFDAWVAKPENREDSPLSGARNIQQLDILGCDLFTQKPHPEVERWTRKVVEEFGRFPNVVWQIANESGVCNPPVEPVFERHMARIIREAEAAYGFEAHLIGTNSENPSIEAMPEIQFISKHQRTHADPSNGKPVNVTEYNPSLSPAVFAAELRAAKAAGTHFDYWISGATSDDLEAHLDEILKFRKESQ